ncbi:MAG: type VI secretion system tube protein TssD [Bacteroidota bacterium]
MDEVQLIIGDATYLVLSHGFSMRQKGVKGQIRSKALMDLLEITVEYNGNTLLLDWMNESDKKHSGSIEFFLNGALVDKIEFTDAYCMGYAQNGSYDPIEGTGSIIEEVSIMPISYKQGEVEVDQG